MYQRSSGLLCHITSLPGPHGIGDLGPVAYSFVDFLHSAEQHLWQVLPLGPAGAGNSPYDSRSSFAGNPMMISVDGMVDVGLLNADRIPSFPAYKQDGVDFPLVEKRKGRLLRQAFEEFGKGARTDLADQFDGFCQQESEWLDDYAIYQAIREAQEGSPWYLWSEPLRDRDQHALEQAQERLANEVQFHKFVQFLFDLQWMRLKEYANERSISIMGDIPIYVALDSADVWSNQNQFLLDSTGQPEVQAGVPPDLFAEDGQLWGNPVYDWDQMKGDDYSWWRQRIHRVLELTDIVRIDHFRGFAAGWQVPSGEETARNGEWVDGPGKHFFDQLESRIGSLPIVVEDLGVITPDVEELRDSLGYPGMKVLQFAFGDDSDNPYLPHNVRENAMVYTGTHDNDTTRGWYDSLPLEEQKHVRRYLNASGSTIHRDMLRTAWASVGVLACAPVQDVLGLGNEARMNVPGEAKGNWGWKLDNLSDLRRHAAFLREITELYGRNQQPLPEE
jgi:4-alpha-glucanotransferase